MQTIIYTNNKRQAANYQVDKMCLGDKIDVCQLIQNQMQRYNIGHLHLWFISNNIDNIQNMNQQKLLVNMGKYLVQSKDNNFTFQYIAEKYQINSMELMRKQSNHQSVARNSTLALSGSNNSGTADQPIKQTNQNCKISKPALVKQELMREEINFHHFKQFQIFIHNQLQNNNDSDLIKRYVFKTTQQSIGISFIDSNKKQIIQSIIDEDCNKIYNARLADHKKEAMHLDQYYDVYHQKDHSYKKTQNVYHKIVLFLFSDVKDAEQNIQKRKNTRHLSLQKSNLAQEALNPWKIKQEDVDLFSKFQKECTLIKQEIQNEKIVFRNKIKAIQNYIGDTINVERLIQEEEQFQSGNNNQTQPNQLNSNIANVQNLKKPSLLNKRASICPVNVPKQGLGGVSQEKYPKYSNNNLFVSSEFKRLKEISEAMRNIDNTIYEQNKKIQSNKNKLKDIVKSREQLLYENAKEFNKIKAIVLNINQQISRKQLQIEQKQRIGVFLKLVNYKTREPSHVAKQALQSHVSFVSKFHQARPSQCQQTIIYKDHPQLHKQNSQHHHQHHQKINDKHSFKKYNKSSQLRFREKKINQVRSTLQKHSKKKQEQYKMYSKYDKVAEFDVSVNAIQEEQNQIPQNTIYQNKNKSKENTLTQQLLKLYQYYLNNQQLLESVDQQINVFKNKGNAPTAYQKQFSINKHKSLHSTNANNQYSIKIANSIDLKQFPILKQTLNNQSVDSQWKEMVKFEQANKYCKMQEQTGLKSQNLYPRDCFQLMMYSNKINNKANKSKQQSCSKIQQMGKMIESSQTPKQQMTHNKSLVSNSSNTNFKPSKFKRITIEEAINMSNIGIK